MNPTSEKPILMSTPMVKATLEDRKTQTRRILRKQPPTEDKINRWECRDGLWKYYGFPSGDAHYLDYDQRCPYGQVGDRLYVKETWRPAWVSIPGCLSGPGIQYKADMAKHGRIEAGTKYPECQFSPKEWKSSRFMPRWASRITLEITGVRVQQIQSISREDVEAEGCSNAVNNPLFFPKLWDCLNAKRGFGWEANPWTWVLDYKRVEVAIE